MSKAESTELSGIAIVGMALRVPGARTPEEYWKNLVAGVESIRPRTDQELLEAGESPERLRHPRYVKAAAVLQEMDQFDPEFFGLSPKEAGIMDPQHRQLLEVAWEALEDSGHTPETFEGPIGVWAGCGMGAYFANNILSNQELIDQTGLFLLRHTGNDKDFLSTRISYTLNLRGPSIGVQTACSTSLVATHYACQALLSGECDMALAGGVTIELPHGRGYMYEEGEILSPDGHCRAFDARSAGTVFGSGAGMVVLRRLEDAVRDGDRIYAVIKGSAVNNDGSGKVGYLAPSVEGQASAVAEALAVAGVDADTIGYVECHGTGTAMGDPIEIAALTQAFRETTEKRGFCAIGSVKTNIGHLDTAAGVASLIKAALCVQHGKLPPSLNFERPNPLIDFGSTPFFVNNALRDFPRPPNGGPRRATVNSLGVGGTNAHVVLEAAPPAPSVAPAKRPAELLVLSGRARSVLDASARRLAQHLREHPEQALSDVAYTLQTKRKPFAERRVLACRDREHAIELLEACDPRKVFTHSAVRNASVVFMFPGGGAQYPNMGRTLYEREPVFKEHMERGLRHLASRVDYDPRELLFPKSAEDAEKAKLLLEQPSRQLPLIYIIEYALAQLWLSWGVKPAALIGHSAGENAAAAVAGVLSFENGLDLVLLRGQLFDEVPEGGMLSVQLSAETLREEVGDELDIACNNAPELSVVSGPKPKLEQLKAKLAEREIDAQWIRINIAAHSRMLEPILGRFGEFLGKIKLSAPRIPIVSNRTGVLLTAEQACSPAYWVEHLRNTILFAEGIGTLLEQPGRVFLEVGPGRALTSLARLHPSVAAGQAFIGSLPHPDDDTPDHEVFLAAFGRLWAAGVEVDLGKSRSGQKGTLLSLPSYAFQHQRYWIEPQAPRAPSASNVLPERIDDLEQAFFAPMWRQNHPEFEADLSPHVWLVFEDDTGLGRVLTERLKAAGDEVISVFTGDTFVKVSDNEYRLAPEQGSEGYADLLREVLNSGKMPDRVVHLWLLADQESFRPGSSFFHRNQERGFFSILFLAQALSSVELASRLHVAVVTRGMQHVAGAPVLYPDQATVLGPCKVLPRELPGVTCVSIDLRAKPKPAAHPLVDKARSLVTKLVATPEALKEEQDELDLLLSELRLPATNGEVAFANGARWTRRYERLALPASERPRIRSRGVYLMTGGLGGIGFVLAKSLAESEKARLVIVNRVPLPPREAWDEWVLKNAADDVSSRIRRVRQLESLGAEVLVCAGDVADLDRMTEIVDEAKRRFGALHGVIHAAGVLDDAPMAAKRQQSVEAVFGPKVYGTLVLDRVLKHEPLDFMVLFSSTSTAIAAAGQADYVAANAFMDAYAEQARSQGRNVLALAWGAWRDVGLAASAGSRLTAGDVGHSSSNVAYPLFTSHVSRQGGVEVLQGTLQADQQWVLDEHRTSGGRAILPGTGYLDLARAALREVGHEGPFTIEDLYFLRPLEVKDGASVPFRVRLTPGDGGFVFEVQSSVKLSSGQEGYVLHAQAHLSYSVAAPREALNLTQLKARCTKRTIAAADKPHPVVQEKHLRFGARWRNLYAHGFGEREAYGELKLGDAFKAELDAFGLHPALLDIATGFAIELEPSYRGEKLWVPVSYERVAVYGDLTQELRSHVRVRPREKSSGFARFDIVLADAAGGVLVEVEGFSMQEIAGDFFEASEPRPQDLEVDGPRRELSTAERAFLHNLREGTTREEGVAAFRRLVDTMPRARVMVSSIDVRKLIQQADELSVAEKPASSVATFERPDLSSEYVAPRTDVERALAGIWENLLGVSRVGVRDDFFELGGHSLIAVRLFARMKKTFGVDYPISTLFERPTIEGCASLIAPSAEVSSSTETASETDEPKARYKHVVPMSPPHAKNADKLPFFLVSGMFGNVMNLRHLASLVGEDRPFHGIQARGLLGDEEPHETFEEMARDYLVELRRVQPHGPYLLGGFSGGGLAAFEMARQLIEQGEEVPLLVMLDTPLPKDEPLTRAERLSIHRQNFARLGARYPLQWAASKVAYKKGLREREQALNEQRNQEGANFRSQLIEAAFYRALSRYDIKPLPVRILLCRPRLKPAYEFGPGRAINVDRRRIYHDNGWTPYGGKVEVFETPGDHDSMVLEPNVRILAARLRPALQEAQRSAESKATRPADAAGTTLGVSDV